jgi:hypothetical protein
MPGVIDITRKAHVTQLYIYMYTIVMNVFVVAV